MRTRALIAVFALTVDSSACTSAAERPAARPNETSRALAFAGKTAQESARDTGAWWLATYGPVDPARDWRAKRAQQVFERMAAAADKRSNRLPQLVMVRVEKDPFALALPDGSIVLTLGALDFCYGQLKGKAAGDRGDQPLAFVLGHELAHLANGHFWHFFAATDSVPDLKPAPRDRRLAELQADSEGAITMAMAGYSPRDLFGTSPGFFARWVTQAGVGSAYDDPDHPEPAKREEFVEQQLAAVVQKLDRFHFGVRLAELGRNADSILLLESFQTDFPGREVLGDLGYANYQLALKALADCDGAPAMRFRLPVAIDDETLAERTRLRGGSSECLQSERVRKLLEEARRYLELAIDKDPKYMPARRNLLALELIEGNGAAAADAADKTLAVTPGDAATLVAKGIGLYLFGVASNFETFDSARELLVTAEADPQRAADAVYALATMFAERRRFADARAQWERFLQLEPHGAYADYVRERLGLPPQPQPPALPPLQPPIPLGIVGPITKAKLAKLERSDFSLGSLRVSVYSGNGLQVLQLNDAIELVEQKAYATTVPPKAGAGPAPVRVDTQRGAFLRYPGVAYDTDGNRVRALVYFTPAR